jgi:hypothetical protein
LARPPTSQDLERLSQLLPLLRKGLGPIAVPLFELLEEAASGSQDPWPLLEGMLMSRDDSLALKALDLAERLALTGSLTIEPEAVRFLGERVETEGSPLAEPVPLATIARMLRRPQQEPQDPVLALYLEGEGNVRRLALACWIWMVSRCLPLWPANCWGRRGRVPR